MLNVDKHSYAETNAPESWRLGSESSSPPLTYRGYLEMVQRFSSAGYHFASFKEAPYLYESGRRFVLIRHDVDLDLEKALAMARLESECGIAATYFFLLRTEHYNVLAADSSRIIAEILALGHRLGLHFDCAAYPGDYGVEDVARACRRETEILQNWFHEPVEAVSFHRPSELVLAGAAALSAPLPHTYQPFFFRQIHYCSDSRGRWRNSDPTQLDQFKQGHPLQILMHPIWWNDEPIKPYQCLSRFLERRQEALKRSVAANCEVYRRQGDNETPA
jgi:hypothetical protein